MIQYILFLVFAGVLGELSNNDSGQKLNMLDAKSQVQVVMNAARYYLQEGAPSITKLFVVDNANEIERLEGILKVKILEDLLDQLVNVWAEMNQTILQGYKALRSLKDKAERLKKKLTPQELGYALENEETGGTIASEVKELLESTKQFFCIKSENLTRMAQTEKMLIGLTARLEYREVKNRLLKMIYSYKLNNLMNLSKDTSDEEREILKEAWVMASAWGKWAVLDLMVFIEEPLCDLHNQVEKYANSSWTSMQGLAKKTLERIVEVLVTKGDQGYSPELLKLFRIMSEVDYPLYFVCRQ